MTGRAIQNAVLFILFFTTGIAAISISAMVPEIQNLYSLRLRLSAIEQSNVQMNSVNEQYAEQIEQIRKNPEVLARLKALTLGTEPQSPDTAYPSANSQQLFEAAQRILEQSSPSDAQEPAQPRWLERAAIPQNRRALFWSGAALVVISMAFFSSTGPSRVA